MAIGSQLKILGILNVTNDSFSDGGAFLAPTAAIAHGRQLMLDGADAIDIGAASSNPKAGAVAPDVEIARLAAVIPALQANGNPVSVDSFAPQVQHWALEQGVDFLNDIHGFADPALYTALAASDAKLIAMHMVQAQGVATAMDIPTTEIFDRVVAFFDTRLKALTAAGVARERLILDPGMGFFLGREPANSWEILRRLPELKRYFGVPLLISVSRKSFLRGGLAPQDAGPASLAAELQAVTAGADYVRTHAPKPLRQALSP